MPTHIVNEMADESEVLLILTLYAVEDFNLFLVSNKSQGLKKSSSSKDGMKFLRKYLLHQRYLLYLHARQQCIRSKESASGHCQLIGLEPHFS